MRKLILSLTLLATANLSAQELTPAQQTQLDAAAQAAFQKSGVPSVSVGVARGGKVVYAQTFGDAQLNPAVKADAAMAYPVGSISKQFTAACILILQQQGKLKLTDPVSRWFPEFTRANEITVQNLLTHTSGYSDYAPQDYTIPAWTHPIDSYKLVHEWATKPLDFEPGTKWQYSNTNFQIAALIVSKASGQTFHDFLWANVIKPLHLPGVMDLDVDRNKLQVRGYERHALGPMRPATLESPGWYSGDGQLVMPVSTLLLWDESIVHRTLLKPESYDALETDYKLKDGSSTGYGLGVDVITLTNGHHVISHSGEVGGFVSNNVVALEDDVAFAALTNFEGPGASRVTNAVRPILLPDAKPVDLHSPAAATNKEPVYGTAPAEQMKQILQGMQAGKLDRKLFTPDANFYFNAETLADFTSSLRPLGSIQSVTQDAEELRGGMVFRDFRVQYAGKVLRTNTYTQKDGKLEQFLLNPAN